jgi:hypothetical protein
MFIKPDQNFLTMLKRSGSENATEAFAGQDEVAKALQLPLREAILVGDITDGIFERIPLDGNSSLEYPLDLLNPGDEVDHVAYTTNGHGYIPHRAVEGDYVRIPTYGISTSIDMLRRFVRDANWNVTGRAMNIMEAGVYKKVNDDAFHVLLAGGVDRNILVYDADAAAGQFTKRLISLLKSIMRRNAGGNTGSINRGKLTDVWLSPEALEDIRNWGVDIVDETTRREIYVSSDDGSITRIFGVNLHAMDELGESQEYQTYFTSQLSGALGPDSDVELVIGLDLSNRDSFVMPIREELSIFADPAMHRHGKVGWYGSMEFGVGVLDNRRILLGSL